MNRIILSVLLVCCMLSASAWATRGAYKWVDDDGVTHYSDRMGDKPAEVLHVDSLPPASADNNDKKLLLKKKPESKTDVNKKTPAISEKARQANCVKAKDTLKRYQSMSRMYRQNQQGNRQYLSDEERANTIEQARSAVTQWCEE